MEKSKRGHWVPEIMYEESGANISSSIPFIPVPHNEVMPKVIFMFESRETGEYEPDQSGEEQPVFEMDLHQYVDMSILKAKLSEEEYDKVRHVVGLEPLNTAMEKGKAISALVKDNIKK
jgi:hypothetical protein